VYLVADLEQTSLSRNKIAYGVSRYGRMDFTVTELCWRIPQRSWARSLCSGV
jgi:hypothetical protein